MKNADGSFAGTLHFSSKAPVADLVRLYIDGREIGRTQYSLTSDGVTLGSGLLQSMSNGIHTLTLDYTHGSAQTTFTVSQASPAPAQPTSNTKGNGEAASTASGTQNVSGGAEKKDDSKESSGKTTAKKSKKTSKKKTSKKSKKTAKKKTSKKSKKTAKKETSKRSKKTAKKKTSKKSKKTTKKKTTRKSKKVTKKTKASVKKKQKRTAPAREKK